MADSQFRLRAITGLTLAAVVIAMTLGGQVSSAILILLLVTGSTYEFLRMRRRNGDLFGLVACLALIVIPVALYATSCITDSSLDTLNSPLFLVGFIALSATALFLLRLRTGVDGLTHHLGTYSLSVVLFMIPGIFSIMICKITPVLLFGVFFLQSGGDVFAYLGGRAFGRHKMAPAISPNKTWEGFLSGMVATAVGAWGLSHFVPKVDTFDWIVTGLLVVIFGTTGDLMQSVIKRSAGIKDSGGILPGHGGIWDRADSFLGCIPWIGMYFLLASSTMG